MKVVSAERPRAGILGLKKDSRSFIMKPANIEFREEKITLSDEMKECFLKLSDMVPDVPRSDQGVIDGTVLMQYVIDYILDLELQLDGQDNLAASLATFAPQTGDCRKPLLEKDLANVATQMAVRSSASPPHLSIGPLDFRPPSK